MHTQRQGIPERTEIQQVTAKHNVNTRQRSNLYKSTMVNPSPRCHKTKAKQLPRDEQQARQQVHGASARQLGPTTPTDAPLKQGAWSKATTTTASTQPPTQGTQRRINNQQRCQEIRYQPDQQHRDKQTQTEIMFINSASSFAGGSTVWLVQPLSANPWGHPTMGNQPQTTTPRREHHHAYLRRTHRATAEQRTHVTGRQGRKQTTPPRKTAEPTTKTTIIHEFGQPEEHLPMLMHWCIEGPKRLQ